MCETERNKHVSELVVTIETVAKLSETLGTVEELSTWRDEWTRQEKRESALLGVHRGFHRHTSFAYRLLTGCVVWTCPMSIAGMSC